MDLKVTGERHGRNGSWRIRSEDTRPVDLPPVPDWRGPRWVAKLMEEVSAENRRRRFRVARYRNRLGRCRR